MDLNNGNRKYCFGYGTSASITTISRYLSRTIIPDLRLLNNPILQELIMYHSTVIKVPRLIHRRSNLR